MAKYTLARCSAVALKIISIIDDNNDPIKNSAFFKARDRDYWHSTAVEAVMKARAFADEDNVKADLDRGIEVTKLFMHVYERSVVLESKTPNNSLLSNDSMICSKLIKVKASQS
jgi:hypothetical protein